MARYSISDVNQMNKSEFVKVFGSVFEETPQVARQAFDSIPFLDVKDLHQKMVAVVKNEMIHREQVALIKAHPELGAKGKMAAASVQEQASAGFNDANTDHYQRILDLNRRYRERFGFPFVMAVKGQTLKSIEAALGNRLGNERDDEVARSLSEIYKIARFRLADIITDPI